MLELWPSSAVSIVSRERRYDWLLKLVRMMDVQLVIRAWVKHAQLQMSISRDAQTVFFNSSSSASAMNHLLAISSPS